MILLDGAEEGDLPRRGVGDEQAILALALHRVPQAIADQQALAVFGETHVRRQLHQARFVHRHRIEIAVDEGFHAGA
ncbi:MAG TPA: hypothetical protein VEQ17_02375, partial [Steroidobacteraceae bacterium]|nr:hypothetical protein [Steroidobacteraceae bacterium]